jgi:hypothetical protein
MIRGKTAKAKRQFVSFRKHNKTQKRKGGESPEPSDDKSKITRLIKLFENMRINVNEKIQSKNFLTYERKPIH